MAAIVVPAGARNIAIMLACLVSGRAFGLDAAGVDRARDLLLLIFREAERVVTLVFDLGLVMQIICRKQPRVRVRHLLDEFEVRVPHTAPILTNIAS